MSTRQNYVICTTTADSARRRSPLTIAVGRLGARYLFRVSVIAHARFPEAPGDSHERAALAYPYANEHEGKLYVGYSNSGREVGRAGKGCEPWNNNSADLVIIPLEALRECDPHPPAP